MVAARRLAALRVIAPGGSPVKHWAAWYGSLDHSLEEAQSVVSNALGVAFEQREDPDRGPIYVSERTDGEVVEILPARVAPPHDRQWWPKRPVYRSLVRVANSSRWVE